jgi:hypothetical protein
VAVKVSLGQTAQCSPCSNLIQELLTHANFWCTRVQILGAVGKIDVGKNKREFKKEKGDSLFLEIRNPWDVWNTLTN